MAQTLKQAKSAFRRKYPNLRVNGWDERDYKLWSAIRGLPGYGLIRQDMENPMVARKDVLKLLAEMAEQRFEKEWKRRNSASEAGEVAK